MTLHLTLRYTRPRSHPHITQPGPNSAQGILPWQVNACLIPVVGGVALASASDVSFTWACFALAMGSNFFFSLRGIVSKKVVAPPLIRPSICNMHLDDHRRRSNIRDL